MSDEAAPYKSVLQWVMKHASGDGSVGEGGAAAGGGGGDSGDGGEPRGGEGRRMLGKEDVEFLEKAIAEMTYDEGARLKSIGKVLGKAALAVADGEEERKMLEEVVKGGSEEGGGDGSGDGGDEEGGEEDGELEEMLMELRERCENLDAANVLHAVGALVPLLVLVRRAERGEVRALSASTLSQAVQNYAPVQHLALLHGALESVVEGGRIGGGEGRGGESRVIPAHVSALSSLLRENEEAQEAALGMESLPALLTPPTSYFPNSLSIAQKIAFAIRHLCTGIHAAPKSAYQARWAAFFLRSSIPALLELTKEAQRRLHEAGEEWKHPDLNMEEQTLQACLALLKAAALAKLKDPHSDAVPTRATLDAIVAIATEAMERAAMWKREEAFQDVAATAAELQKIITKMF